MKIELYGLGAVLLVGAILLDLAINAARIVFAIAKRISG